MRRATFEKLVRVLGDSLETDARKVRYGSGPVTPRIQLTMCLKFLGGDSNHDIKKHMGGLFMLCVHHRQKQGRVPPQLTRWPTEIFVKNEVDFELANWDFFWPKNEITEIYNRYVL